MVNTYKSEMREMLERHAPDLVDILNGLTRIAIAYSGGLDSRFLCHSALICGCDVLAIHASGPHIAATDTAVARKYAAIYGLDLRELEIDPLDLPEIRQNGLDRCYACKKNLFAAIRHYLEDAGEADRIVCDGGNSDDLNKFRPGLLAIMEANVKSPLAMASLDKKSIRRLMRLTEGGDPEQLPRPCLLTRFQYGLEPDKDTLHALSLAEAELSDILTTPGIQPQDFRIRLLPQPVLHISGYGSATQEQIDAIMRKYGFTDYTVEVMPSVEGYFDRMRK